MCVPSGGGMGSFPVKVPPGTFEDLREFDANGRWLDENYQSLQRLHPEMYVAVYRCAVLDAAWAHDELVTRIRARSPAHSDQILIEYIYPEDTVLVL